MIILYSNSQILGTERGRQYERPVIDFPVQVGPVLIDLVRVVDSSLDMCKPVNHFGMPAYNVLFPPVPGADNSMSVFVLTVEYIGHANYVGSFWFGCIALLFQ